MSKPDYPLFFLGIRRDSWFWRGTVHGIAVHGIPSSTPPWAESVMKGSDLSDLNISDLNIVARSMRECAVQTDQGPARRACALNRD